MSESHNTHNKAASNWINQCVSYAWYTSAVALVVVAVLLSALRLSLPNIDKFNPQLSAFLSQRLDSRVSIDTLTGTWNGGVPSFNIQGLTVSDPTRTSLSFASVTVDIDLLQSALSLELVTRRVLLDNGDIMVNLLQPDQQASQNDLLTPLRELFLEQLDFFNVTQTQLTLSQGELYQTFLIDDLSWVNRQQQHLGSGRVFIAGSDSGQADVKISLTGKNDSISGNVYLNTQDIKLDRLLNRLTDAPVTIDAQSATAQTWLTITGGKLANVRGKLDSSSALLYSSGEQVLTQIKNIDWQLTPVNTGWHLQADNIEVRINDDSFTTQIAGTIATNGQHQFSLQQPVPLHTFNPLLLLFSEALGETVLVNDIKAYMTDFSLSRKMSNAAANQPEPFWVGRFNINDIAMQPSQLPGLTGFNVGVDFMLGREQRATINVGASQSKLIVQHILSDNIHIEDFTLTTTLSSHTEATDDIYWQIESGAFALDADVIDTTGTFSFNTNNQGVLNVNAQLDPHNVQHLRSLLPQALLGPNTYAYLRRAFAAETGEVESASLRWRGAPQDFPFRGKEENKGQFEARVALRNASFAFDKNWPALDNTDIDLHFINDGLFMSADKGQIGDTQVSQINASIPQLGNNAFLNLEAKATGSGFAISDVLVNSGLRNSVGKVLTENVVISNPLELSLDLTIPFDTLDVVATGNVTFDDNYVFVKNLDLPITQVSGNVNFNNENVTANDLSGVLLEQPISFGLALDKNNSGYGGTIDIAGNWSLSQLFAKNTEMSRYFAGSSVWQSQIELNFPKLDDFSYAVNFTSDLINSSVYLPDPFAKSTQEQLPLTINAQGTAQFSEIQASLGNAIRFDGVLPHEKGQFSRAHLSLGNTQSRALGTGFSIAADLPVIEISAWQSVVQALLTQTQNNEKIPVLGAPERVFINADEVQVAGQTLDNVDATLKRTNDKFELRVVSNQARGEAIFHDDLKGDGVVINADYVNLTQWNNDGQEADIALNELPAIALSCDSCTFLDFALGELELLTQTTEQGIQIQRLRFNNGEGMVESTGLLNAQSTELSGIVNAADFGAMLTKFGFDTGITDSQANIEFTLRWPNAFPELQLATLNGQVNWEISDGYLAEVSDQGSRIFTLVSLDSIIRKLSLDFRDVFAQGFYYDEIAGTLQIEQGIASTIDTVVDGGAGEIEINGYTDLAMSELNYNVSFTPDVTGNLPALMYFMVNPPSAIAAIAVNEVLTSAKVFSNVNYSITGNFAQPIIVETGRTSSEIILPARVNPAFPIRDDSLIDDLDSQGIPVLLPTQEDDDG